MSGISLSIHKSVGNIAKNEIYKPDTSGNEEPMPTVDICAFSSTGMSNGVEGSDKSGILKVFKDEPSEPDVGWRESREECGRIGVGAITGI